MPCTHECHAKVSELEAMLGLERAAREKAEATCQFVVDRLDFVEPMYWAARRNGEGLWAANIDL